MPIKLPGPSGEIKPISDAASDQPALSHREAFLQSSEKPRIPVPYRDNIPRAMQELDCWVGWSWKKVGKKWTKVPETPLYSFRNELPDGLFNASSTNPVTWASLNAAWEHAYLRWSGGINYGTRCDNQWREPADVGLGFMVTPEHGICFVDLDDCRNPDTGVIADWARKIIRDLDSYTEISPSKTGVKVWLRGKKNVQGCKKTALGIEVYVEDRPSSGYWATPGSCCWPNWAPAGPNSVPWRSPSMTAVTGPDATMRERIKAQTRIDELLGLRFIAPVPRARDADWQGETPNPLPDMIFGDVSDDT